MILHVLFVATALALVTSCCEAFTIFPSQQQLPQLSSLTYVIEHLFSPPLQVTPLEELINIRIPGPSDKEILAYEAIPSGYNDNNKQNNQSKDDVLPSIILIHEFFGLNPSIIEKAEALSNELNCRVIAPDTFRGQVTDFIPKAIWLALSTPQDRVNDDLNYVCSYIESENKLLGTSNGKFAIMGFCYGGGKAIRYTTQCRQDAATVIFYGSPLTDEDILKQLNAPVCAVYGNKDAQFPKALIDKFQRSLDDAGIENNVRTYDNVGHAFWSDMGQIRRGDQPQTDAYEQCISFLRDFFDA